MIYAAKPVRMAIYVAKGNKTMDEIKAETDCDIIINGGLFELKRPSVAYCHLKAAGKVYAKASWTAFGYGWHDDKADIRLTASYDDLDNYICCDCLVKDGHKETLNVTPDRTGKRPRTAIGLYPDGRVWFYADPTPRTPESMQAFCMSLGLDSAVMLDGGSSTQGISPSGAYRQARKCHNYILAWLSSSPANPCPYAEPDVLISRWSYYAEGARWVQWHLNYHGAQLAVDGIIGGKTHAAIVTFQLKNGLTPDGIVGPLTRDKLRVKLTEPKTIEIVKPDYVWGSALVTRAATNYIVLHHAAANCTPMQTHIFHRDTKGWAGIGYNFFVAKDGTIYEGRPIDKVGAHCSGYNSQSVGVCFEGNFETEEMPFVQKEAGKELLKYLRSYYPNAQLRRHSELDATACPGKNFPEELRKER